MSHQAADLSALAHFPLQLNVIVRWILTQRPTVTMALGSITVSRNRDGDGFVGTHASTHLTVEYGDDGLQRAPSVAFA